ncbi:PREDICTED: uncharacterized protein LOC107066615 isoform X2 [Polistes dominula]|uniref:Uncharacterized protein LOC107066615 isoform X2 n=1 Tax=Polistes dominula TaxID=743375 RepID=A0ABM1I9K6_POLDO|nr:PREDICTED: uncharacterized protein LOC107066615 isoform X2 [Polistes dominula]
MNIVTKDNEFFPEHFVLCNFYGNDECFCWNNDKFVMFSYNLETSTSSLPVLIAPGQIKNIQCFSNRVFFTCSPRGVYKLSREGRFSVLSKSAISIGSMFFEILKSMDDCLYLENKQDKSSKLLLRLPPTSKELEELCTFSLNAKNSEDDLRNILLDGNSTVDNLCLIDVIEDFLNEETSKDDFIDLHKDMLKDTNLFVEQIYEKSKELESCNKVYAIEKNKINRINLYACKMKVQMIPKMTVSRIAKQLFLNVDFPQNLPNNVYIICFLVSNCETIFSIKKIANNETSIDLPLEITKLFNSLYIGMDLITMINKEQPWFLIKDFLKDPEKKKNLKEKQMKKDKTNFINSKINLIRNLIMSKNLTMKKLSEIKEKIRKEISEFNSQI